MMRLWDYVIEKLGDQEKGRLWGTENMRRRYNRAVTVSHSNDVIKSYANLSRKQIPEMLECLRRMYVHAIIQEFKPLIKVKYNLPFPL